MTDHLKKCINRVLASGLIGSGLCSTALQEQMQMILDVSHIIKCRSAFKSLFWVVSLLIFFIILLL